MKCITFYRVTLIKKSKVLDETKAQHIWNFGVKMTWFFFFFFLFSFAVYNEFVQFTASGDYLAKCDGYGQ